MNTKPEHIALYAYVKMYQVEEIELIISFQKKCIFLIDAEERKRKAESEFSSYSQS